MKTPGLNFLEAVQALVDEKCIGIKRAEWTPHLMMKCDYSTWSDDSRSFKAGHEDFLATDWLLVSPIIPTDEREVKRWISLDANGEPSGTFARYPNWLSDKWQIIELTGTYRVPVKEKVRKRVSWQTSFDKKGRDNGLERPEETRGKSGTLTFDFEE